MQVRFFTIPVMDSAAAEAELNSFLRSHRILAVEKELVPDGRNAFWSIAVEYLEGRSSGGDSRPQAGGKSKTDYKEVLTGEQFTVFSRLRDLRKEIAEAEGVPVYVVFTNEQLAEMARLAEPSKSAMLRIEGVGEGKFNKYGDRFLAILAEGPHETTGGTVPADPGEGEPAAGLLESPAGQTGQGSGAPFPPEPPRGAGADA